MTEHRSEETRPAREPAGRAPGWREVLLVAAGVVLVVFVLMVVTSVLPRAGQDLVFRTPLAIVLLTVGTVGLLAWIVRRPSAGPPDS